MNALTKKIAVLSTLIVTTATIATAGTIPWSGAGAPGNINWNDDANWVGNVPPGAGDTALFDNSDVSSSAGPGSADNIVNIDFTIEALMYGETNTSPMWHNTVINAGTTLTVSSTTAEIVLDSGTQTDPPSGLTQCYNTIGGDGSLTVDDTNTESVMIVSQGSSTYTGAPGLWASLDMSSLNTFQGTFGRLLVGVQGVGATPNEVTLNSSGRQSGKLSLALTNIIHLTQTGNVQGGYNAAAGGPALIVVDAPFWGDNQSVLSLGQSNAIWADSITIGRNGALQSGVLQFNPNITGPQQLFLRGESSNRVSELIVADATYNGSYSQYESPDPRINVTTNISGGLHVQESGLADLSAGTSDIMIDTLILGMGYNGTPGGYVVGQLNMGAGTLNVNSLELGFVSSTTTTTQPVTGILNVDGGTVVVNDDLLLGVPDGAGTAAAAAGDVTINGGGVWANNLINSGGPSSITINGGSLVVTNPLEGTPLPALSLDSSTGNGQASINLNFAGGPVTIGTLTIDGNVADHIVVNVSALPEPIAVPATITLFEATTLTVTAGTFNMTVGTLPAGYSGGSIVKIGNTVELVVTAGPATGSIWTGVDAMNTANFNWSDANNWYDGIVPTAISSTIFNNNEISASPGIGFADNIVDVDILTRSLWYAETNTAPFWHNTFINAGKTLTVSNNSAEIVLDSGTQTDPVSGNTECYNTIAGNGSLVVIDTNSESVAIVSQGSSTYTGDPGLWASLDMSNLLSFDGTFGRLLVGVQGVGETFDEATLNPSGRQAGIMSLAATNVIRLTQVGNIQGTGNAAAAGAALVVDDTPFFGDFRSSLTLGQSNAIWADTITVGRQQCNRSAFLQFNPVFTPSQLFLRGESSNRVSEFVIGDNTVNGGTGNASPNGDTQGITVATGSQDFIVLPESGQVGSAGVVDLSAGTSDLMIDTLIVGKGHNAGGGGYAAGIFNLGLGTLNVNSLLLGVLSSSAANLPAFGTVNVDSGTVMVNTELALGQVPGGGTSQYAYGTLNIFGGSVWANAINNAGGASSINIHGGSLVVTNPVGSAATLSSLAMDSSTNPSSLTLNISSGALGVSSLASDGGSANNTINISGMPQIFLLPTTIPVIQAASAIALTNGTFNFVLGTLPAGYTGYLVNGGSAVELTITKGPLQVNAWTAGDAADKTNWSDALNWGAGVPTSSSAAFFNAAASQTSSALSVAGGGPGDILPAKLNNIVNTSFTIAGLVYTNVNRFENTSVSSGNTLTVSTFMTVGVSSFDLGKTTTDHVTISGPGTLDADGSFYVGLGDTNTGSTAEATLDMSGLAAFNANVENLLVGVGGYAEGYTVPQPVGVVYLAETNDITATSGTPDINDSSPVGLEVGDADTYANSALATPALISATSSALYLGQSNSISADNISVGRQLATGAISFNPAVTNSSPTAVTGPWAMFSGGGGAGTAVATWTIGDGVANPLANGGGSGSGDFTGGYVQALVNTLTVANSSSGSDTASSIGGKLTLAAGTINAGTLNISYNNAYSDGNVYSYGVGTVDVSGTGSLVVNGAINLAWANGPLQPGAAPTATLNVSGAGASVSATSVVAGTNGATSIVTVSGGSLAATNGLGTPLAPVTTLNLTNATITEGAEIAPFVNAQNINVGGAAITFNVLALPPIEVYPISITLVQSVSTIKGSVAYDVVLPVGFVGSAALSGDSKSVVLTLTSGLVVPRGNVHWVGPDPVTSSINWSDPTNWFLTPVPAPVDTAYFDNTGESASPGAVAVDNIVDENLTVLALWYAETNSDEVYGWHNTVINPGVTLTIVGTNDTIVLDTGTQTDPQLSQAQGPGSATCYATISGPGGSLVINNTNQESFVVVSQGSGTYAGSLGGANLFASLDMSGLDTFNGTFGRMLLGIEGAAATPGVPTLEGASRQSGRIALAATNIIHMTQVGNIQGTGAAAVSGPSLVICDLGGTGGGFGDFASYLFLGQSNALWADTITVGREGAVHTAVLEFNPVPPWSGSQQLFLRGESSPWVSELIVADNTLSGTTGNSAGNGGLPSPGDDGPAAYTIVPPPGGNSSIDVTGVNPGSCGVMDVSAGTADMMINTLVLGQSRNTGGGGYEEGVFIMGPGTLNVNTLILANMSSAAANVPNEGIFFANDPTGVVIVNDQIAMGQAFGGGPSAYAYSQLNIIGTVEAASITTSGNSAITVTGGNATGGVLALTSPSGSIGTAAAPIGSITLASGTTLNLAYGGSGPSVVTSNLTGSGSTDTINVTSLPLISGQLPQTNVLVQSLAPIQAYDFVLGTLPGAFTGSLQESADGTSVLLVINSAPFPVKGAKITSVSFVAGNLVLTGTNGVANDDFVIVTSTNLAAVPRWTPVATNTFDGNGNFNISLPYTATTPGQFYSIKSQ
jgi:hypothetical protein